MIRRPPRSTRTDPLFPYTTLFRSADIYVSGTPMEKWDENDWLKFGVESQNWMLSQFMHGEQGTLICTAKIVETVPWIDAKYYASTQVMDERSEERRVWKECVSTCRSRR